MRNKRSLVTAAALSAVLSFGMLSAASEASEQKGTSTAVINSELERMAQKEYAEEETPEEAVLEETGQKLTPAAGEPSLPAAVTPAPKPGVYAADTEDTDLQGPDEQSGSESEEPQDGTAQEQDKETSLILETLGKVLEKYGLSDMISYDVYDTIISELHLEDTVLGQISGDDIESVVSFAADALKMIRSQEFRELVDYVHQHEEIIDLINTLLRNAIQFVRDEPDLTRQILQTMGVSDSAIDVVDQARESEARVEAILAAVLSSKEGQEIANALTDLMSKAGEAKKDASDIIRQLLEQK